MRFHRTFTASCLALSAFSIPGAATAQDSNGAPTTYSTPQEQADTVQLNQQSPSDAKQRGDQMNSRDSQYQAQQQQYQEQLQQNEAARQQYEQRRGAYQDETAAYEALRARYATERAAYRRYEWPATFSEWRLKNDGSLMNVQVHLINGNSVGNVVGVAHGSDGVIEALQVMLDDNSIVWIDAGDVRFDQFHGTVITDLYPSDIRQMARERIG